MDERKTITVELYGTKVSFDYGVNQSMYNGSFIEELLTAEAYIKADKAVDTLNEDNKELREYAGDTLTQGIKFQLLAMVCLHRADLNDISVSIEAGC